MSRRVASGPHPGLGFVAFVLMIASLQALGALGVDAMLPNLPAIGRALGVRRENDNQLIITSYVLGLGVAQIVYGSLADRFGRRPVLLGGIGIYTLFSLVAALSPSFRLLLIARVLQGVGAAATRVLPISIVRDCYQGREMARVMSLASMVFMAVPVLAPTLGQAVTLAATWPWVFGLLAGFGLSVLAWTAFKLPETLHPRDRIPIAPRRIRAAVRTIVSTRATVGYSLAQMFMFGGLLGFIGASQEVFAHAFHAPGLFTLVFAIAAGFIAVAALLNTRLVMGVGMRVLSHGALLAFIVLAAIEVAVASGGRETLIVFTVLQSALMFCFGFCGGNFSAMAMEPMGHMAGIAASLQGFVTNIGAALIGFVIGQQVVGSAAPIAVGYLACGVLALGAVLYAEGGRLFRAHHLPPPERAPSVVQRQA